MAQRLVDPVWVPLGTVPAGVPVVAVSGVPVVAIRVVGVRVDGEWTAEVVVVVPVVPVIPPATATWIEVLLALLGLLSLLRASLNSRLVTLEDVKEVVVLEEVHIIVEVVVVDAVPAATTASTPAAWPAEVLFALLGTSLKCLRLGVWVGLYIGQHVVRRPCKGNMPQELGWRRHQWQSCQGWQRGRS